MCAGKHFLMNCVMDMITFFPESEKYGKKIKKAKTVEEYQRIVDTLFREMGIV